ncbi:YbgF trimerization domain-containing protein [Acinetobacter variabilis]|uniref:YbgF trimerization domain-containing protein n=2 Tax=Acinetobacter variabilis TaxID=70346 RepID=UPI003D771CF0
MMFKKQVLCALTALCTTSLFAAIPIESRGLSQGAQSNNISTQSAIATGADAPQTNTSWQLMQKNQQLENDLRSLRGKIEEQENEIERLKSELTNRYADLDQRLELLQQKIEPAEDTPAEDNQQDISPSVSSNAPVATNQASTTQQPSEQEKAAYTIALDAYKNGGAAKAIAPMQNFIKNNPNSVYISNAHFWLAEFNLSIDPPNFNEAKKNYLIVVDRYPNSAKASTALYQLYNISKDVEKNATLASQYKAKLLKNYPKAEEVKFLK